MTRTPQVEAAIRKTEARHAIEADARRRLLEEWFVIETGIRYPWLEPTERRRIAREMAR